MKKREILSLFLTDFRQFVKKTLPNIKIKFATNTKGHIEFSSKTTLPAVIYLPQNVDEYTQLFITLHELGHLYMHKYMHKLGMRQNEFVPDLLAVAYMYEAGYDPTEILSILEILYDRYENVIRSILAFLLLYYLEKEEKHGCECYH
ncbi:MAG: ImmA/IrrE family metallo-endopeptidase [candidate division WOR-3 bacterium]